MEDVMVDPAEGMTLVPSVQDKVAKVALELSAAKLFLRTAKARGIQIESERVGSLEKASRTLDLVITDLQSVHDL